MGVEQTPQAERMRELGYTEEEIADMLKCDREIDRGADLFPLSADLEQGAKRARRADRTDTPKKAERKPNEDKRFILQCLVDGARDCSTADKFEIVNPEREFLFTYNGIKYKVVLSAPRT